jgi:TetR/AcrR family transcriptional regulator, regulator of autoinduction and epiphytic fitness
MPSNGNTRRRYNSERRRQQAQQTRGLVLDAAAGLFVERGYEGTSMAAIADRAGVSVETVYGHFGNKRRLLGDLMQRAVRGDESAAVPQQTVPQALTAVTDQREQLRLFAADIAPRLERAAPLVAVIAGAARSDPELAALLERLHGDRLRNLGVLVDALTAHGQLRLPADQALETVWALTSPELHQLLVRQRGWTARRYREWLATSLAELLLP